MLDTEITDVSKITFGEVSCDMFEATFKGDHDPNAAGLCDHIWDKALDDFADARLEFLASHDYDPDPELAHSIDPDNYVARYLFFHYRKDMEAYTGPRWTNLSAFNDLPSDLLYIIAQHLHPIDLYNLIRTTRTLRAWLLHSSASKEWEKSYLNHPDIPFYPEDLSAPMWTSLLFGPATCDVCNCKNAVIDVTYRWRRCDNCSDMVSEYYRADPAVESVISDFFKESHPRVYSAMIGPEFARLVRRTYTIAPMVDDDFDKWEILDSGSARIYKQDLIDRAREIAHILNQIPNESDAFKASHQYIRDTTDATKQYLAHANICKSWRTAIMSECVSEYASIDSINSAIDILVPELEAIGHNIVDIRGSVQLWGDQITSHFRESWIYYKRRKIDVTAVLHDLPLYHAYTHLTHTFYKQEHQNRVEERKGHLSRYYLSLVSRRLLPMIVLFFIPDSDMVCQLNMYQDYLKDPAPTVDEFQEDTTKAKELICFVLSVIQDRMDHLAKIMNAAGLSGSGEAEVNHSRVGIEVAHSGVAEVSHFSYNSDLDLALTIFECESRRLEKHKHSCPHSGLFIGWREALRHHSEPCSEHGDLTCSYDGNIKLDFSFCISQEGQDIVKAIARLLGVDPLSLKASDLDARNARFVCRKCADSGCSDRVKSLDWRSVVQHSVLSSSDDKCRSNDIVVLSADLTEALWHMEQPYPLYSLLTVWVCNHCSAHLDKHVKRAEVLKHIKNVHNIRNAVVDTDYFINYGKCGDKAFSTVCLQAEHNYQCLRCSKPRSLRLRAKRNVFHHLKDKHGVLQNRAIEGTDWRRVKLVDGDTWIPEGRQKRQCLTRSDDKEL